MPIGMEELSFWLRRAETLNKEYSKLNLKEKKSIEKKISKKIKNIQELLEPDIRANNGFNKVIEREADRLRLHLVSTLNKTTKLLNFKNFDELFPGMVKVPKGKTIIGSDKGFLSREEPEKKVIIPEFYIDKFAVTNSQYEKLISKHKRDHYSLHDDQPVVNVTWFDAHRYCSLLGKRLPSSFEWEKAARGPKGDIHSFGNEFSKEKALIWPSEGTVKVDQYEPNVYGVYQMSGNIWEWTAEIFCHEPLNNQRIYYNLARGGSWKHCQWGTRASLSICFDLMHRSSNVGFRCAC